MSDKKIAVDGVSKSFVSGSGTLPVIDGVSFDVDDGEFVAMVGAVGLRQVDAVEHHRRL